MWPPPSTNKVGIPDLVFAALSPGPPMPLSTLGLPPREGQDGSLLLSCGALASPTKCRFIPALLSSLVPLQNGRARGRPRRRTTSPANPVHPPRAPYGPNAHDRDESGRRHDLRSLASDERISLRRHVSGRNTLPEPVMQNLHPRRVLTDAFSLS